MFKDQKRRSRSSHFQHSMCDSILSVSGKVVLRASRGDSLDRREFHWNLPPLALPDGTTASVAAALRRMPIRIDSAEGMQALAQHATAVVGMGCMDRAATNVSFASHVRAVVDELPSNVLYDDEWCDLHSCNNMKVASKDLCAMTAKYYTMATLMKANSYAAGAISRLDAYVSDKLVRHCGVRPDPELAAKNRAIVHALYDFDAPHHRRIGKDGVIRHSELWHDLQDLLALDTSDWRAKDLIC